MICPICDGDGTHVNPSIDAHGLSREDFDDDPDFAEDYMRGVYNVACQTCGGSGKIRRSEWKDRKQALREAAEDRRLAMLEDGIYEPGMGDWRYGA
jgi:hypothetical protein